MTRKSIRWMIVLLLACVAMAAIGSYLRGGSALLHVEASPDGLERLEVYQPTRWQRLLGGHHDHDDVYARLTRAADDKVLGTSPIFYLNGAGELSWTRDRVDIGVAASFDRRTRSWDVNPGIR